MKIYNLLYISKYIIIFYPITEIKYKHKQNNNNKNILKNKQNLSLIIIKIIIFDYFLK